MKNGIKLLFGSLFVSLLGIFAFSGANNTYAVIAEPDEEPIVEPVDEPVDDAEPEFECSVVLNAVEHGDVLADKLEGHAGDIVVLTVNPEIFYIIDSVSVNGTTLIESETTSGEFSFALVEGENVVAVNFVINQELLGQFSTMIEQASNKDWTNLFSVKNVVTIVSFFLNSGLLIVIIRYFVKDKKLEKTLEKSVQKSMEKLVPEATKQAVLTETETILTPYFSQIAAYQEETVRVLGVLVKCIALQQENTPESRMAILDELSNLKIGDIAVIEEAKRFIDKYMSDKSAELTKIMEQIAKIMAENENKDENEPELIEEKPEKDVEESVEEDTEDGTAI